MKDSERMFELNQLVLTPAFQYNESNLAKLALFLNSHPIPDEKFDMGTYSYRVADFSMYEGTISARPINQVEHLKSCKTSGCAAGWAPVAGIEPSEDDQNWNCYIDRVFFETESPMYKHCFAQQWPDCPKHAAKRIAYMLQYRKCYPIDQNHTLRDQNTTVVGLFDYFKPDWELIRGMVIEDSVTDSQSPSPELASQSESSQSSQQG